MLDTQSVKLGLDDLDATHSDYAMRFVDRLLESARQLGASDVHVLPDEQGLDIRWRIDGVLQSVGRFPAGEKSDVVTRLKVLAQLLTYRTEVPQEGRIQQQAGGVEMRVSTFPTLYGERATVRFFAAEGTYLYPGDLGLPAELHGQLTDLLSDTSGAIIISGPAGSGKTTTAYACLRHLVRSTEGGRSIVSLEDPIEVAVSGVAQSQVNAKAGFDLSTGLRSIMRQDPEVIMVGEIRDHETAETVLQAALTGHLVITTFHAGSAAEAVSRLLEMDIEPYVLRSGILAVLNQRLVRRLCDCSREADHKDDLLGLQVNRARLEDGCEQCLGTGFRGRSLLAEMFVSRRSELGRAILSRAETAQLEQHAIDAGMITRWQRAAEAIESGLTSPSEVRRVLGLSTS